MLNLLHVYILLWLFVYMTSAGLLLEEKIVLVLLEIPWYSLKTAYNYT